MVAFGWRETELRRNNVEGVKERFGLEVQPSDFPLWLWAVVGKLTLALTF